MSKNQPELSVVIPVYNNQSSLDELVRRLHDTCSALVDQRYEIVLVDDGSWDASWETIDGLSDENLRGLRFSRNFGQHAALKAGFVAARGKLIVMMDADLEDAPETIEQIYLALQGDVDICYTNLMAAGATRLRQSSNFFHRFTNSSNPILSGKRVGTMRGFTRPVLDALLRHGERRPVYGPLITTLGFRQTIIDVEISETKSQQSSYSFRKRARLAVD